MRIGTREALNARREQAKAWLAEQRVILVCAGTGCIAGGAMKVYDNLQELCLERKLKTRVALREEGGKDTLHFKRSGCQGFCEMGPLIEIQPEGIFYTHVHPEDCEEILEKTILHGEIIERLLYKLADTTYVKHDDIPFYKKQKRVVLETSGNTDAEDLDEYLAHDGYAALEKALFDMPPAEICAEVVDSGLRGRGGAGFPTGKKWESVRRMPEGKKYVVCNGDEGDPGAFMDCSVMEGDPHRMLEGMMIAGRACGAHDGYIYVRAEYPMAVERLKNAIAQAEEMGLLGENILGSGFDFHMHINKGAGAFVCGEGSALTASIEGKRGFPRVKPPRTVEHGLFNEPTVLNNVETFANVPLIISNGADWYKTIGPENSPGTKAFALTGNIENTGLIEVPMGTTLEEVIYGVGGGMRGGSEFKAVQIGGPSGGCLTTEHLKIPLDFDSLKKVGAMIGSGGMVVMDSKTCMVEVARFFMSFTQNESCGKCVPCREGTKRMLEVLERIVAGKGQDGDIELLEDLADTISAAALCGLGKTAPSPVMSTIKYFRDEYEAHIYDKRCPAGACPRLKRIHIDPELCRGCSRCAKGCPVGAISGQIKSPFVIDEKKCIKCGACVSTCAFHAIKED